jgi:hypothetical protein
VRRAFLVHVDANVGLLVHDGTGRPGVIEVDVRQHDRAHVGQTNARLLQPRAQRRQRAGRPGIDQRHAAGTVEDNGRDDARHPEEVHVDVRDSMRECVHG